VIRRFCLPLLVLTLLTGCGSVSLWPFGESETSEKSRKPANATEYRCDGAKSFYVRNLDGGAVWLIAPDREIRLDKQPDGRYGVGKVMLEISSEGATLTDPPTVFMNCKRAG
jgi:uncharacterized protein YceK